MKRVLAFDLGGSSGRAILAEYKNGQLTWQQVHRFENRPRDVDGRFCWDFEDLMANIQLSMDLAGNFDSIGVDTWGVDFGLLDEQGKLLGDPVHYRDARTNGEVERALSVLSAQQLYAATGNQIMPINTLFQLQALRRQQPEIWKRAHRLLFIPDLIIHRLCGAEICETTIASTSQMLDPSTGNWSRTVLDAFDIPENKFAPLVASGTVVGQYKNAQVIAVAGHDTQCAVAAMPIGEDEDVAFLSCGTWSLLGCELPTPILSDTSRESELSNEIGANRKIQYLKNMIGLWLIQESRRQWQREGTTYTYGQLEELAQQAAPFRSFIDPAAPEFTPPGNIPERVRAFCRRTHQPVPETIGQVIRCIYESLALQSNMTLKQLSQLTGRKFSTLHMLGGGVQSELLCRMHADCTGRTVFAGPVEATALGNIIIQLSALKEIEGLEAGRTLIAKTEPVRQYVPQHLEHWKKAYERYHAIIEQEEYK